MMRPIKPKPMRIPIAWVEWFGKAGLNPSFWLRVSQEVPKSKRQDKGHVTHVAKMVYKQMYDKHGNMKARTKDER